MALDKVRGPRRVDERQKGHGRGCKMLVWHSQLETEGVGESSLVRGGHFGSGGRSTVSSSTKALSGKKNQKPLPYAFEAEPELARL